MPKAMFRICSYPGCNEFAQGGSRCEYHKQRADQTHNHPERHKLYGRTWQKRRAIQLSINPWCEECLQRGLYVPATDVHHVKKHEGSAELFVSSPLESLCHSCHSKKTSRGL